MYTLNDTPPPLNCGPRCPDTALAQLRNLAQLPCLAHHVAVMPDVHAGKGSTIGAVIATTGAVIPAAVGVDIGCGMCAVPTSLQAADLPDDLKPLRLGIEAAVPVGFNAHNDESHLASIPSLAAGQADVGATALALKSGLKAIVDKHPIPPSRQTPWQQLGTLGGGNHFIEVGLDETDRVWIMLHSGSRGIGNRIGMQFIALAQQDMGAHLANLPDKDLAYLKEGSPHFDDYVQAVAWAQQYAALNRILILNLVLEALKRFFPHLQADTSARAINCHHNYVTQETHYGQPLWITRKGAVSARKGQLGIIPGSMGTHSYIVEGLGNPESFHSCSHGAGRRLSRTQAKRLYTVADHQNATAGVECRKDAGVIDETPMAYKSIDTVMANQQDLVKPLHTLRPIICVKG
ncbi:MAG: RtcB family protein [Vampirovibrionales bacterium]